MAVTATFLADFTSFQAAVDRAEVKLRSFATGAAGVEKSLTRMGDAFSGRKVLQEAELATKAVASIGGASKLTESEQKRLNATLTEALAKYRALGLQAPKDMQDLAKATQGAGTVMESLGTKAVAIGSFIGTAIGNLAAQAVQRLGRALVDAAKDGAKFSVLSASFERLTASIGQSADAMLVATRSATKGLISDLDLMQSSNKAILLGLPVTAREMGDLSKAAITLGRAMGQDATKSLDDLITALGRSSPLILDNLGLTVKVGEANEAYARTLGKTSSELTDAEQKQAFYNAAMEAARRKTDQLGDVQLGVIDQLKRLATATGNVVTEMAAAANESGLFSNALGGLASAAERAAQNLRDTKEAMLQVGEAAIIVSAEGFVTIDQEALERQVALIQELRSRAIAAASGGDLDQPQGLGILGPTEAEIKKIEAQSRALQKTLDDGAAAARRARADWIAFNETIREHSFGLNRLVFASGTYPQVLSNMRSSEMEFVLEAEHGVEALLAHAKATSAARLELERLGMIVPSVTDNMASMSQGIADGAKTIFDKVKDVARGSVSGLNDIFQRAFEGGGGIGGAIKSMATNLVAGFTNMIPVVGPFISQFSGAIVAGFSKLGRLFGIGKSEGRIELEKANANIKKLQDELLKTHGSLEQIAQMGGNAGRALADAWGSQNTAGLEHFTNLMNEFNATLKQQEADAALLDEAIKAYGFSIEELGPALQRQQLGEQALTLAEHWRVLVQAGVDVEAVNLRMSDAMAAYLNAAIKTGQEVPAEMRGILQSMIDQGVLLDDNGNKITDLGQLGITFAETLTEGFDRVVEALALVARGLGVEIPAGIGRAARATGAFGDVSHTVWTEVASDVVTADLELRELGTTFQTVSGLMGRGIRIPIDLDFGGGGGGGRNTGADDYDPYMTPDEAREAGKVYIPKSVWVEAAGGNYDYSSEDEDDRRRRREWEEAGAPREYRRGGFVEPRYLAGGGWPWRRGTDTVPAMLTPGEGVLSRRGMAALDRLNGGSSGMEIGPALESLASRLQSIEALLARGLREQPRAVGVAVRDALVLAS